MRVLPRDWIRVGEIHNPVDGLRDKAKSLCPPTVEMRVPQP